MDEGNYTNNEESVWRASEGKWLQQRSEDETAKSRRGEETLKFASYVKERRWVMAVMAVVEGMVGCFG